MRISKIAVIVAVLAFLGAACTQTGTGSDGSTPKPEPAKQVSAANIALAATEIPPPITRKDPQTVKFVLETKEVVAKMDDGATYEYWTFDGTVPGPLLRVREGDTAEVTVRNPASSKHLHSIDLHAVEGPGGGHVYSDTAPGKETTFRFKAQKPGIYLYHCASEHIPTHIANGMYGLILVEPAGGLSPVDLELYIVQGDFYTKYPKGTKGHQPLDGTRLSEERPTYVVFNGKVGSLLGDGAPKAKTGQKVRIFFGVGGPNISSNFHLIGEIFDKVYPEGDLLSPPHRNVQTTVIPSGGAAMIEFAFDVPGTYILVDHAISRAVDKGALGTIVVEGNEQPELFSKVA